MSSATVVNESLKGENSPLAEKMMNVYSSREDVFQALQHVQDIWSVRKIEQILDWTHSYTGLPWWATIVLCTLGLRSLTTPFNVLLLRNTLRMKLIRADLDRCSEIIKNSNSTDLEKQEASVRFMKLLQDGKCHPLGNWIIPVCFPPLILSVFGAMNNKCLTDTSLAYEGALWFPNLMDVDQTGTLYVLSGLTWLWNVEIAGGSIYLRSGKIRMVTRVIALGSIPIVSTMPAGIMIFWITSNLWEITRVHTLRSEAVRKYFGIPLESQLPPIPIGYW
jgi:YidC/Oxa1 family membrane protein insertase